MKKNEYKNLYQFWQSSIEDYFKNTEIILNLASEEYSKMFKNFRGKIITVDFKVFKNKSLRSVSVYSKQQRGKLLNHMATNNLIDLSFLEDYSSEGFKLDRKLSDNKMFVYIRSR